MDFYGCSNCGKKFATRRRIIRHLKNCQRNSALSIKPYSCEHCEKNFFSSSGLLRHGKRDHGLEGRNNKTKLLRCEYPAEKVFLFFDPSHAVKLVRNTFGDYSLKDADDRPISFFDIMNLYNLQLDEDLMSAPKLTKRHINWRENKMKVRLAVQVLSSSVSAALLHAKKKSIVNFNTCEGTAAFCKEFDSIFDMLNSRSVHPRNLKHQNVPIRDTNKENFLQWCQTSENYICGLKIGEKSVLNHDRKSGFLGLIMCLQNIVPLFEALSIHGLKYLLTYKLSQDHLENWFSAVRRRGGNNNNPNSEQFKSAFKRLLVHHEIRAAENANCANEENITILSMKSTNSVFLQHGEECLSSLQASDLEEDITSATLELDTYQKDVVAYISGFIIRKLQDKKLAMMRDLISLKDGTNNSDLIDLKNRGNLILPSQMMVEVCAEIEKQVQVHKTALLQENKIASIVNIILCDLDDAGVFEFFDEHIAELIVEIYVKMRIKYFCRQISQVDKNIRHTYTKQVLFQHQ